ncbi:uncharacterized protein JCM6883_007043 [Sporobolomyces salmoneus]|uniref:uncharacterized protein n=1 Tax=Sporobolomyces salmoneus TaxID=183962 RepID=UPI0031732FD9
MLTISTTGSNLVVLNFTVGVLVTILCSGVIVNYARVQPPQATRLWTMTYSVISFLIVVWLLLCALTFVVASNVLYPGICSSSHDPECDAAFSSLAFQTFIAISIAVLFSLVVHFLLSYDLQHHLPIAQAALEHSESADSIKGYRQVLIVQTAFLPISQEDPEQLVGYGPDEKGRLLLRSRR